MKMSMNDDAVPVWGGLAQHIDNYGLIICDLWGVMHNGLVRHSAAEDALLNARRSGTVTIFLSNAPQPRFVVKAHLAHLGFSPELLDNIVTSGGLARDYVRSECIGKKLYHMGPPGDHRMLAGLPVVTVDRPEDAEIILATGLDFPDVAQHQTLLRPALEAGAVFLCANPDRVVHEGDRLFPCAGAVADIYEAMGGSVYFFGKPMASALHACARQVGGCNKNADRRRTLMIGDSLQTDIMGAKNAGFDSLLIAGGIHRGDLLGRINTGQKQIERFWFEEKISRGLHVPDGIMSQLVW